MQSSSSSALRIVLGPWERLGEEASSIRCEVFIREQGVAPDIEQDDYDAVALHAIAYTQNGVPVATGRLLPDGHIGRIAVLKQARGAGVGGQVLDALIEHGHCQGHSTLVLHAQMHAQGFYEARGFVAQGVAFMEAGIAHVVMSRVATKDPDSQNGQIVQF